MEDINIKQFMFCQPNAIEVTTADKNNLKIANQLLEDWHNSNLLSGVDDDLKKVVIIGLMGYFQDILCDAGLWRTFVKEHRKLYGQPVPFHDEPKEYIDFELNKIDVAFLLWYFLAFNSMQYRFLYPLNSEVIKLSDILYKTLENNYENATVSNEYSEFFDIDVLDKADSQKLLDFSQWLFWKSWLILPPFQLTFAQIYSSMMEVRHNSPTPEIAAERIEEIKHQAMTSLPTGPLALYLKEWLQLIFSPSSSLSNKHSTDNDGKLHPYYEKFVKATNGKEIIYIQSYNELNKFFIEALGWKSGEEHLSHMKDYTDFVLMVTPNRGLMVAKNIAKCVADPNNPLYDKEYAKVFSFNLLSQRGVCPGDMLKFFIVKRFLPDAAFPEDVNFTTDIPDYNERRKLTLDNIDFIARAYLQEFYRADD